MEHRLTKPLLCRHQFLVLEWNTLDVPTVFANGEQDKQVSTDSDLLHEDEIRVDVLSRALSRCRQ